MDAVTEGEGVHAWFAFVRPRKLREGDIEWLLQIWADQCSTSNIPGTCPHPYPPTPGAQILPLSDRLSDKIYQPFMMAGLPRQSLPQSNIPRKTNFLF